VGVLLACVGMSSRSDVRIVARSGLDQVDLHVIGATIAKQGNAQEQIPSCCVVSPKHTFVIKYVLSVCGCRT
jgi:hypothetical protein